MTLWNPSLVNVVAKVARGGFQEQKEIKSIKEKKINE
jgi:hypothetical protein